MVFSNVGKAGGNTYEVEFDEKGLTYLIGRRNSRFVFLWEEKIDVMHLTFSHHRICASFQQHMLAAETP